jgi:hypothetical protein
MLIERIKTSLILPKIMFAATVFLFLFAGAMAYTLAVTEPSVLLEESAGIQDRIDAVIKGDG